MMAKIRTRRRRDSTGVFFLSLSYGVWMATVTPTVKKTIAVPLGDRQVKAYPRTQTDPRTVGKANGRRIIGAFRKTLFGTTFRFVLTCLDFPHDEAHRGTCRR